MALWVAVVAAYVPLGGILLVLPAPPTDAWALPAFTAVGATWSLVGALVATRVPRNIVGWILVGVGLGTALVELGQSWVLLSDAFFDRTLPGTLVGAWLTSLFSPVLGLGLVLLPLLFPDGRLPSPRWRIALVVAIGAVTVLVVAPALRPGDLGSMPGVRNPFGIDGLEEITRTASDAAGGVLVACLPLSVLAATVRFRRGQVIERLQLKWFGSAVALAVSLLIVATLFPETLGAPAFMGMTGTLGLIPIAIGIAILRYRLYEIDRLVGRTIAYTVITAVLAAAFLGTNLGLQAALARAAGTTTLATAVSTLLVAALFQPLRRRVQRLVDRRFNRSRVDGERIAGSLATQARDQVDLERLLGATLLAVDEALAPSEAAIWLRASA